MKKCPSRSLTPYLDEELAPDVRTEVEGHLQGCASCGALLDEVTSARERVRSMGRALIPDTVLVPALETFRQKGGIGQARQMDLSHVSAPAGAAVDPAMDEGAATAGPEDERYHAVLNKPLPDAAVVPEAEPVAQVSGSRTWVNVASPEPEADPVAQAAVAAEPVREAPLDGTAEAPEVDDEEPSAAERWLGSGLDGSVSPDRRFSHQGGPALVARPEPPAPQQVPPWLEAQAADAEDVEAHGRRVIEEDLAADRLRARSLRPRVPPALPAPDPPVSSHQPDAPIVDPEDEQREPRPNDQAAGDVAPGAAAEPQADSSVDSPRKTPRTPAEPRRRTAGLGSLDSEVKIGMGIAVTMVLLLAAFFGLPRLFTHRTQTVASTVTTSGPAAHPASQATATPPPPSPQASAVPVVPPLTDVRAVGSAGGGYRVYRIRTLNPKAGLYLVAFDLQGSGPLPDVQLGQAADHTLYLQSAGTTIDPALASAFSGAGPVTAMSPTGAAATSLKLTTSRPAHFFIYYLTGPSRLVIELS